MMDDDDDEETSISIINGHVSYLPEDAATVSGSITIPQYHMFSGAIPKDVTAPASHHALKLAYKDLKKRYDLVMNERRNYPQQRRSLRGPSDSRRKSATMPVLHTFTNGVSYDETVSPRLVRSGTPRDAEQWGVADGWVCPDGGEAEILRTLVKDQDEEIDKLKQEVADLRLTIAGRESRESAAVTTSDDVVRDMIKQMQVMRKLLQQQTQITRQQLERKTEWQAVDKNYKHRSISGLHIRSSMMTSVDSRTDNKLIPSIDEEDSSDYTIPSNRVESNPDIYGMPNANPDMTSLQESDWRDEPMGASGGEWVHLESLGATVGVIGNQHRRGALPPRAPLRMEHNGADVPVISSHDNVGLSVNFDTPVSEQRHLAAVLNNDPLAGHKPVTSHRNIFRAEASNDKMAAQAEAATMIVCPVCLQEFNVPQNSPEFQHHVDECIEAGSSAGGPQRRCPVCNEEFPATIEQKDYEIHVNRHFEEEDITNRFVDILDFGGVQTNENM